ncbi:MAG: DUF3784 domain-containing protein [Deltaproteobacteria bacterium]
MSLYPILITVGILVLLATVIKYLGGEMLIAGYNTSSAEARKYMKEKGIGAFVGNYIYLLAAIILTGYLLRRAGIIWGQEASWGVFIAVIIVMLVRVQRFNPPPELTAKNPNGKNQTIIVLAAIVISVLTMAGTFGGIYLASRPAQYTFSDKAMQISGSYGTTVSYTAIDTVQLEPKLPSIGYKDNGLDMGAILKGHFQVEKLGRSLLFLRSAQGPVIIITFKDKQEPLLINMPEPAQTRDLYQKITSRVGK